jgi:hypothetical protein
MPWNAQLELQMILFRLVGYILFLVGLGFLIADGARTIAANELLLSQLGQVWYDLDHASLNGAQAMVQRYLHPYLWDPIIQTILKWPTFAVALVLSLIFVIIGRPRQKIRPAAWY